jgi:starch-binding outer membrane protein SusE/F
MKNIFRLLAFSVFVFSIGSCEKKESKDFYEGGTPPVLSASAATISLEPGQESNTALTLNWTNPDYRFTTGISSLDVTYTIEMDTLGANFASSKKVSTVISKEFSKTYTVGELNSILGNDMLLQLNPRRNYTMQVRVISSIGTVAKLTSNVISFTTKPFQPPPKVEPPTNGTLWIVGDAPSGPPSWSNPVPPPYDVSFKFTKLSTTLYELTVPMTGAPGGYKLIQIQGDWATQYHMLAGGTWAGGDFEKKDSDPQFPGGPTAGNYKITVDFQLGKYTVVKL